MPKTTPFKNSPSPKKQNHKTRKIFDQIAAAWGSSIATRGVERKAVPVWSTGIASLDIITTCGGYPRSCVVEIFGPNQAGKTALALAAMAQMSRFTGRPSLFLDLESETMSKWMLTHGMDLDQIDHVKMLPPGKVKGFEGVPSGESLVDAVVEMIEGGEYGFIVLDSIASLLPSVLVGKNLEEKHARGLHSNFIGDALKHIIPVMQRTDTCMIAMNQIRMKADAVFGNPEYTTGGLALAHYKSMSVRVSKGDKESTKGDKQGAERKLRIIKNRKGEPFGETSIFLHRKHGLLVYEDLFLTALRNEVLVRTGKKDAKYACPTLNIGFKDQASFEESVKSDLVLFKNIWEVTVAEGLRRIDVGYNPDEEEEDQEGAETDGSDGDEGDRD